jgi:hypothetical protein
MSTVQADLLAVSALRAYLLRTLPAKITTLNTERAAVLKAPRAGPYVVPASGSLVLGATVGSEVADAITAGSRTATQVAADISTTGIAATVDAQDRLTLTATAAPVAGTPSVVSLGPEATAGTYAAFGWSAGGEKITRSALPAPTSPMVQESQLPYTDLGSGLAIIIGERTTEPRSGNIRDDTHRVLLKLEILVAEPNASHSDASELVGTAARAVREVLLEDRTLDGAVHLTELPKLVISPHTYRFAKDGPSFLLSKADMTVRIHIFERN